MKNNLALRIEEASLNAWTPFQQLLYDGWILRFAEAYTKRANSVNPIFESSIDLNKKINFCEELFTSKNLQSVFRLNSFSKTNELEEILIQRNYEFLHRTSVQFIELENLDLTSSPKIRNTQNLDEWISVFEDLSGGTTRLNSIHKKLIENIPLKKNLMILEDSGKVVSCGLGVLEDDFIGIFDVVTHQSFRKKGFGRMIVNNLMSWGKIHGAKISYLQVMTHNLAAWSLYEKIGFKEIYNYWYRVK
ncbi:MAG: GNAT family N-acetyltransferase [Calditrichaeota bacterium]|nr:MAG: GNAT family N-acetyltransferase [Calditrichota bacterium]